MNYELFIFVGLGFSQNSGEDQMQSRICDYQHKVLQIEKQDLEFKEFNDESQSKLGPEKHASDGRLFLNDGTKRCITYSERDPKYKRFKKSVIIENILDDLEDKEDPILNYGMKACKAKPYNTGKSNQTITDDLIITLMHRVFMYLISCVGMRQCYVHDCLNADQLRIDWYSSQCRIHNIEHRNMRCTCDIPFKYVLNDLLVIVSIS